MIRIALLLSLASGALVLAGPASGRVDGTAEQVTIFARPATLTVGQRLTLYGSIANGKPDEIVTIQVKECGATWFTGIAAARTRAGGGWSSDAVFVRSTASVRAVWNGHESAPVTVRQRASVQLRLLPGAKSRFEVFAWRHARKRVQIQRYDGRFGTWSTVRTVVIDDSGAVKFTAFFPRGTSLRAVLPLAQARPCFLAGTSRIIRT